MTRTPCGAPYCATGTDALATTAVLCICACAFYSSAIHITAPITTLITAPCVVASCLATLVSATSFACHPQGLACAATPVQQHLQNKQTPTLLPQRLPRLVCRAWPSVRGALHPSRLAWPGAATAYVTASRRNKKGLPAIRQALPCAPCAADGCSSHLALRPGYLNCTVTERAPVKPG